MKRAEKAESFLEDDRVWKIESRGFRKELSSWWKRDFRRFLRVITRLAMFFWVGF